MYVYYEEPCNLAFSQKLNMFYKFEVSLQNHNGRIEHFYLTDQIQILIVKIEHVLFAVCEHLLF